MFSSRSTEFTCKVGACNVKFVEFSLKVAKFSIEFTTFIVKVTDFILVDTGVNRKLTAACNKSAASET